MKGLFCDSVIGHPCQNIVGPRGESSRDNNEIKNSFQSLSLMKRDYGDRTVSFSEDSEGKNCLVV